MQRVGLLLALLAGCTPVVVDVGGGAALLEADPGFLAFDTLLVGEVDSQSVVITNVGLASAEVSMVLGGESPSAFGLQTTSAWLDPGKSMAVVVVFHPSEGGSSLAELEIGPTGLTLPVAGVALSDVDGDGFGSAADGGDDCDDEDAAVHPGADDVWYDGVDADCEGNDDQDQDADGAPVGTDCDDTDPRVAASAPESWNGADDDCNGQVDDLAASAAAKTILVDSSTEAYLGATDGLLLGSLGGVDAIVARGQSEEGQAWVVEADGLGEGEQDVADWASGVIAGSDEWPISSLQALGDANLDGLGDLMLAAGEVSDYRGSVWVVDGAQALGGPARLTSVADCSVYGDSEWDTVSTVQLADVNGDGQDDLIVGSPYDQDIEAEDYFTGNVAVFVDAPYDGSLSLSEAAFQVHGEDSYDQLGWSLAAADVDGDGRSEVLAGAPGAGHDSRGALYLLEFEDGDDDDDKAEDLAQMVISGSREALLGGSTQLAFGDLDDDGEVDLAVGTRYASEVGVFFDLSSASGDVEFEDAELQVQANESLGAGLAIGMLSGGPALFVGAPGSALAGEDAGAVYVFGGAARGELPPSAARAVFSGEVAGDQFGTSLAVGDLDGDGQVELLVGAPGSDRAATNGGAAYLFSP